MPERHKLPVWILPLLLALLVAGLGWWGNGRLRANIEEGLKAQLTTTLNANVTALGIWATNQTRLATSLAEDSEVRKLAGAILLNPRSPRRESQTPSEASQFASYLNPRISQLGYGAAQLVNSNFYVVATSMPRAPFGGRMALSDAHTNKFAEVFANGEPVLITPFKPEPPSQRRNDRRALGSQRTNTFRATNRPPPNFGQGRRGDISLMQVAAPLRDTNNTVIGALALIINPDQEFSRILSVARSGDSGETYAFDQTGLMISHSRFDEQLKQYGLLDKTNSSSALNLRLHDPEGDVTRGYKMTGSETNSLTRLVASAVDGADEVDVMPARDYRGVPVVGASCWLPQFGFGVATQIDAAEAYRPLRVLQAVFAILVLLLLLCATAMFVISNITWSRRLTEAELKLKQLGQYTLEEKIGEGGMGVVYRARHALMRRDTAVKLLLPDRADSAAIARFEREVVLTCQLTHPNTIQVYDYGHTPDGIFYYAMEFLRGVNLHDLVANYGPQPEGRVIYILAQICDSLAEAHALGLIHRDIKPGNIFLCRRGGVADCVKVLDFGLVREYRAGGVDKMPQAEDYLVEGTPWFMPPEAIKGHAPVGPRSDLYSLGALGYYLLTGHYIFDAEKIADVYDKQLTTAPIPPSQRTAQPISADMEQLLLRCLEKDLNVRPQSALELRSQLLALTTATHWTIAARSSWWDAHENQVAGPDEKLNSSTPLPTVSIDLAGRME
jgi:serine/threonine protein kinase